MSKGIFYLIILTVFLLVIWEINEIVTIGFQYTGIKRLIAIFFCFCIILFWKYNMVLAMVLLSILLLALKSSFNSRKRFQSTFQDVG